MMQIVVSPLSQLAPTMQRYDPSHLVSLMGPGKMCELPKGFEGSRLALEFNDIGEQRPGLEEPKAQHIEELINFVEGWRTDRPILFHCWMGVSRSTAAAIIAALVAFKSVNAGQIANKVRELSPMATPNPLMISLADQRLELGGKLIEGVAKIGRGQDCFEGIPFGFSEHDLVLS